MMQKMIQDCWGVYDNWEEDNIATNFMETFNVLCIGYERNPRRGTETDAKSVAAKIKSYNIL